MTPCWAPRCRGNNTGPSSAIAVVHNDGSVHLTEGSPDIGGTRASITQQCAETLSIAFEDIHPEVGHTDAVGFTSVTGGSGVTFKTGWAAYHAAQDIKRQMCERTARSPRVGPSSGVPGSVLEVCAPSVTVQVEAPNARLSPLRAIGHEYP
jgi:CO/xanthine dehydrogenase Mo-binding subunit